MLNVPGAISTSSPKSASGDVKFWINTDLISVRAECSSSKASIGARWAATEPESFASTVTTSLTLPTFNVIESSSVRSGVTCKPLRVSAENPEADTSTV
jgi:hypothetical protein